MVIWRLRIYLRNDSLEKGRLILNQWIWPCFFGVYSFIKFHEYIYIHEYTKLFPVHNFHTQTRHSSPIPKPTPPFSRQEHFPVQVVDSQDGSFIKASPKDGFLATAYAGDIPWTKRDNNKWGRYVKITWGRYPQNAACRENVWNIYLHFPVNVATFHLSCTGK